VEELLRRKMDEAVEMQLEMANDLPADDVEQLRFAATYTEHSFEAVLCASPAGGSEGEFVEWIRNSDSHTTGTCPLGRLLEEDAYRLLWKVASYIGLEPLELRRRFRVVCVGGEGGRRADFCESAAVVRSAVTDYEIRVGHGFLALCLVAAKTCAARFWMGQPIVEKRIPAKAINDLWRMAMARYLNRGESPAVDLLAHSLQPYQLLLVDRLLMGMSTFALAHELGHVLLWWHPDKFSEFRGPSRLATELVALGEIAAERLDACSHELMVDLLAIKLIQDVTGLHSAYAGAGELDPILNYHWAFSGAELFLSVWEWSWRSAKKQARPSRPRIHQHLLVRYSCARHFPRGSRTLAGCLARRWWIDCRSWRGSRLGMRRRSELLEPFGATVPGSH
jgi:hypothetical protein